MKKFLKRILLFVGIPIALLLMVYLVTDPFKTLHPFSFQYYSTFNREYPSYELFVRNDPKVHYNSFIIGSSRCNGFNTYHWKHYLPEGARQYLFQAWSESVTGIEQKIDFLDRNGNSIDNALVLIDIPKTFADVQLPKEVVTIKHYRLSGQSKWAFQACLFYGFVQEPSKWISFVRERIHPYVDSFPYDTISNDYDVNNQFVDISIRPSKDSLSKCTSKTKEVFLKQIMGNSDTAMKQSKPLINEKFLVQLQHIKAVFDKHHTDYRIVVSPAYCYQHEKINSDDLRVLQSVFGKDRVYDFSGNHDLTTDCYDYSDPDHFGPSIGWQIIEDIYNK